VGKVAIKY
jgi:hypothetical protein